MRVVCRPLALATLAVPLGLASMFSGCQGREDPCAQSTANCAVGPDSDPDAMPDAEPEGLPPVELPPSDNALDRAMVDAFQQARHVPQPAGSAEICRRLSADLLGRYFSEEEARATCNARPLNEVIEELQATDAYLLNSQRRWQDRLGTSDIFLDWRYLKHLYAIVDDMQRGELDYDAFAVEVIAHPGFNLMVFDAPSRARRTYRTFLGREASEAEANDLASLFRTWLPGQEPDPDFPYLDRTTADLYPYLCTPVAHCQADVLGGGQQVFESLNDYMPVRWDSADATVLAALRVPGEMVVRQRFFWEAAADDMLDRFLDWDNGAREPRRPGYLYPALRQALADHLEDTNDYPSAERLVLTSWLYTQTAEVTGSDDETPVFTSGPVKAAPAELWLDMAFSLSPASFGSCDPRYGDGFPYFLLYQAIADEVISAEEAEQAFIDLNALRDDRMILNYQDGYLQPDYTYAYFAGLIGGCPGFQSTRQSPTGLAYAFQQESMAETVCSDTVATLHIPPNGDLSVENVARHLMPLLLGRSPTPEEELAARAAVDACEACSPAANPNNICVALLGSAGFLFY